MASAANLENKQSSNKACRKTKYYPKKTKVYLCILEQTNPVLVTLVQGSINIESMSEIDFLAVSAILMIISDFYWHWLLMTESS